MALVWDRVTDFLSEKTEQLVQVGGVQYVLVTLVIGAYLVHRLLNTPKYRLPPGPSSWPLIGNLLSLTSLSDAHKNFTNWRKQYGDMFTVYVGRKPCVVLTSVDKIKEAFVTKGHAFGGRIRCPSLENVTHDKDMGLAQPGPVLKRQRHVAHLALRKYVLGDNFERNAGNAFDGFMTSVTEQSNVVDIPSELSRLMVNFLASACFGRHFEYNDPWLCSFAKQFQSTVDKIGPGFLCDLVPSLKFLEKSKLKMLDDLSAELDKMLEKEYIEHKETFDPEHPRDLLDEIILQEQTTGGDGTKLDKEQLMSILIDVLQVKAQVPKYTLGIVIGHLVENPEIQAKLHQELDDVLGENGHVTLKNKDQLPYVNAVIHESMRVEPTAPLGFPHLTTADTELGGYSFPKGTPVIAHIQGVHQDAHNFANPDEFNPERWIDENGKFKAQQDKFIPFSVGPRMCPGESLARVELQMFTAMLLHKYEFTPVGDKPFKLKTKQVTMAMEPEPFQVRLNKRY